MRAVSEKTDVGVLVGRFQVPELHKAHMDIINHVIDNHDLTAIFLGMSPTLVTRNNPLNFPSRKQMLVDAFGDKIHSILYIKDMRDDKKWSRSLDGMIRDVVPNKTITLYGGRESFISHYSGLFDCQELEQESYISGSVIRKMISNKSNTSSDFREGVIWAAHNQYVKAMPTVDVAIWDERHEKLLMARKPGEDKLRFVGGFVDPKESLEKCVRREVSEETHLEVGDIKYIGSAPIDDWRYKRERDGIITMFFSVTRTYGKPTADDDIAELRWVQFSQLKKINLVEEHAILLDLLMDFQKGV